MLLLFLGGAALLSAAGPPSQDLSRALNSPTISGWALADFKGDDNLGLATASAARHDARGYAQVLHLNFGSAEQSSFKFRSRSATVDLSAPDIDGDLDYDLVIREPLSRTPIGVWLNDGEGSFHEGNLADFPALSRQGDSWKWRVQHQRISLLAVFDERIPLGLPQTSAAMPRLFGTRLVKPFESARREFLKTNVRSRAPPLTA
jgi:hypothetical protein